MTPRAVKTLAVSGLLATAACDEQLGCTPVLRTEHEQLELTDLSVVAQPCEPIRTVGPVLAGTTLCPQIECNPQIPGCEIDEDERLASDLVVACFVQGLDGPGSLEQGCVSFEEPGEVRWSFSAQPCEANELGFDPVDDALTLPAVQPSDVQARLQHPGDAFALRKLHPGPAGEFPLDAQVQPGKPVYVLADHPVDFAVVLEHPDHDGPVAWEPGTFTLVLDPPDATAEPPKWRAGVVTLALSPEAEVSVGIQRDDVVFDAGTIRAVSPEEIETLEVVAGYLPEDENDWGHPVGARAVARTKDGSPVWGVPVRWEVTQGALPVWRDETRLFWGSSYVALMDDDGQVCHAEPEATTTYEATLIARHADLQAQATLSWDEEAPDEGLGEKIGDVVLGRQDEHSERCQGPGFPRQGCGCTASGRSGPVAACLLVLLFWGSRRRC